MAKANMSATLLRKIIASKLGCDPTQVILSGEIKPDYIATTSKHTSFDCSWEHETTLYAMYKGSFEVVEGVHDIKRTNGHETNHEYGIPLYKIEKAHEAILFVEVSAQASNDWIQEIRVYKPADFAGKLAQVTQEDIARWENWLTNE